MAGPATPSRTRRRPTRRAEVAPLSPESEDARAEASRAYPRRIGIGVEAEVALDRSRTTPPREHVSRPVSQRALRTLLESVAGSIAAPISPDPLSLVDLRVAADQARRFKVEVSFALALSGEPTARFSINDKGEPEAFRERLLRSSGALGVDRQRMEDFFALSPPGAVQTTVAVKWSAAGGRPERLSLYCEELCLSPEGPPLIEKVTRFGLGVGAPPPWNGLDPIAVCVDIEGDRVVGVKDYWMATEVTDAPLVPLSPRLEQLRRELPISPSQKTRRYLLARRLGPGGERTGAKIMWMPEAQAPEASELAWSRFDALCRDLALPVTRTSESLAALRRAWPSDADCHLDPDLVSLDVGPDDAVRRLVVYVSVK